MKIGIVGSREYENKLKIKEFIYQLKEKFGEELVIVSGGQKEGADGYAKKFSLGFDVKYAEFLLDCVSALRIYFKSRISKIFVKVRDTKKSFIFIATQPFVG